MRLVSSAVATTAVAATLLAGVAPAWAVAPPNDDFDNATVVAEPLPFTDSVSTVDATTAADDPDCFGNSHTVWYTYTPSVDGFVNANTFGSDYDTTLSVYTGTRGALTQVACDDDTGDSVQSSVTWEIVAGTSYHLMAGSFDGSPGGTLSLTVQESGPPPPAPTVDVTVAPRGTFDSKTGVATLHGTFTCTNADFVDIFGEVTQSVGRVATIRGFFEVFDEGTCDGSSHSWTADVSPESGKFKGGKALTVAFSFACGAFECAEGFTEQTVRLSGGRN
jgi:hypothetical protein